MIFPLSFWQGTTMNRMHQHNRMCAQGKKKSVLKKAVCERAAFLHYIALWQWGWGSYLRLCSCGWAIWRASFAFLAFGDWLDSGAVVRDGRRGAEMVGGRHVHAEEVARGHWRRSARPDRRHITTALPPPPPPSTLNSHTHTPHGWGENQFKKSQSPRCEEQHGSREKRRKSHSLMHIVYRRGHSVSVRSCVSEHVCVCFRGRENTEKGTVARDEVYSEDEIKEKSKMWEHKHVCLSTPYIFISV